MDLKQRPNRLVQKIFNSTSYQLYDEYRHTWNRANREIATDREVIEQLAGCIEGIDLPGIEFRKWTVPHHMLPDEKTQALKEIVAYSDGVIALIGD